MYAVGLNAAAKLQVCLFLSVGTDAFPTNLESTIWSHVSHIVRMRPNLGHGLHVPLKQGIQGSVELIYRGSDLIVLSHGDEFSFSDLHTCDVY